jgi:hypothetical protein
MKIITPIILFLLIIGCVNQKNQKDKDSIQNIDNISTDIKPVSKYIDKNFEEFLLKLEPLELPHEFKCYDFTDWELLDKLSELRDTVYSEEWDIPYKRVLINDQFESVIFLAPADMHIPVIRTFDLNGNLISELQLFTSCGQEPGYYARQFVTIETNLEIARIDSTWTCEVNNQGIEDKSTEKLEVSEAKFKIKSDGEIIEL